MSDLKKTIIDSESVNSKNDVDSIYASTQVLLPSKGKLYQLNHPLANQDYIEIREMTAREEDILTSRILLKKGVVIDKVLENCIIDKRIKPLELLVGDRNAILLTLRILGYGQEYSIQAECPVCSETQKVDFNLNNVKIKLLSVEPLESNKNVFEFVMPKTKCRIRFKLLTALEEQDITRTQENFRKSTGIEMDNLVTSRITRQILSIDGNEDRSFISKFVSNLPLYDSRAFKNFVSDIEPDIIMKDSFVCKNCGDSNEVDIPITTEFFWPAGNR